MAFGGEIGSAFVRIRPDTHSFKAETESGVKGAFAGVGKIIAGAIAVTGFADLTKHLADAAAEQQVELASVKKAVENTGAAWEFHGKQVDEVLKGISRSTGFTIADVSQSFVRLESGTKNTAQSFKLLGLAADVSRARHLGLAQASVILTRASQGSSASLRRLGIVIPNLSVHYDTLKGKIDKLVAGGDKFTAAQKLQIKDALAHAKALDVQASKVNVISEVEKRFGGQSKVFAQTAQGQFARLHENLNELAADLGTLLLPGLAAGAAGISHWVDGLRESQGVHDAFKAGVHDIGVAFNDVKAVVETIGPPLVTVARGILDIGHAIGSTPIITFVATFKALAIASAAATAAQAFYNRAVQAGVLPATEAAAANTALAASEDAVAGSGAAAGAGGMAA